MINSIKSFINAIGASYALQFYFQHPENIETPFLGKYFWLIGFLFLSINVWKYSNPTFDSKKDNIFEKLIGN